MYITNLIAGWFTGANINARSHLSIQRTTCSGSSGTLTPTPSSTFAEPQAEDTDQFPALAAFEYRRPATHLLSYALHLRLRLYAFLREDITSVMLVFCVVHSSRSGDG